MSAGATGIVVAAGRGERFGGTTPKALTLLAGEPLLVHAVRALAGASAVHEIVVVAAEGDRQAVAAAVAPLGVGRVVPGGRTRTDSVRAGVAAAPRHVPLVAVHDAARPLASSALVDRTVAALEEGWSAAAPGLPVVDTLKLVGGDRMRVVRTVDRRALWAVQTPQVFARGTLEQVLRRMDEASATDDLALVEAAGGRVRLVQGEQRALKVTYPEDLALAEALLAAGSVPLVQPPFRIGHGVDVHAFAAEDDRRPLVLAGVEIPGAPGLEGHSDGDAVLHGVVDAVLGAAGLGDIGSRFGTDEVRHAGAASSVFLEGALGDARTAGWAVGNVDVTVVAARPRLAGHRQAMREGLAALLGVPVGQVAVKATTTDGLGFAGRGEGIACLVTVLLVSASV